MQAESITVHVSPRDDAAAIAEAAATLLRRQHPGLTVLASAADGGPAKALIAHAEEVGADLIVVGNKRVQGPARILGSIASDVTAKAHCDVYVAHTHSKG